MCYLPSQQSKETISLVVVGTVRWRWVCRAPLVQPILYCMTQETPLAIKPKNVQVRNVPNARDPVDDRMCVHPQGLLSLNEMPVDIPEMKNVKCA
jgi:hypothetical protein